jgi:hypothetical protein
VILAASVAGASHVRREVPCQDAFRVHDAGDALIIAVADGLGSAARSELGSSAAVDAAVARAAELGGDPCRAAVEGVVAARDAIEKLSYVEDRELRDVACTLIVVVADARIGIAHVGDGAVVGTREAEPFVLSPPAPSEYVNEVDSLASVEWVDHVRAVLCVEDIDGLAVFTDGCQHAAIRRGIAHAGFFGPLFDYVRGGAAHDDELATLLRSEKMCEHSDDDKTLVLADLR